MCFLIEVRGQVPLAGKRTKLRVGNKAQGGEQSPGWEAVAVPGLWELLLPASHFGFSEFIFQLTPKPNHPPQEDKQGTKRFSKNHIK